MTNLNSTFQIISNAEINATLTLAGKFEVHAPFFLLVKHGTLTTATELINALTITLTARDEVLTITQISDDCECMLLTYDRQYVRSMTFQLNILDAFKYIYANAVATYELAETDFSELWLLTTIIQQKAAVVQNGPLTKSIIRHLNYSFLYSCIEKIDHSNELHPHPINQQERIVFTFFQNLNIHVASKLNVSDYAEKQNITTRHLAATVKKVTGMAPLDIIHRLLLSKAKEALTTTDKPITEIALSLGYSDPYTFSHFFKKQSGMNPTDFRASYQD